MIRIEVSLPVVSMAATTLVSKGTNMSELQEVIFGKAAKKELMEMGLGCLTTARIDAEVSAVHLIPIKQRESIMAFLKGLVGKGEHLMSKGYYFVPRVVMVTIAHVQGVDGVCLNSRLTDTARIDLSPLEGQVLDNPLTGDPTITVFFPTYSIPLGDEGDNSKVKRNFIITNRVVGGRISPGNSVCSTFSLWSPEFSMKPHSYQPRNAISVVVRAGRVEGPFNGGMTPLMFVKAACENTFAETGKAFIPKSIEYKGIGGSTRRKNGQVVYRKSIDGGDSLEDWDKGSISSDISLPGKKAYVDLMSEDVYNLGNSLPEDLKAGSIDNDVSREHSADA